MNFQEIALRLRRARALAGMTQQELADASGIGIKTISSFESGQRITSMKVEQLYCLLTTCGVTLTDFFRGVEPGRITGLRYFREGERF